MLTENVYYSEQPKQFYLYPYDGARMCRADFPVDVTKIDTEEDKQYLCNVYSLRTAYFESLEKDIESDYKTWLERAKEYTEARKRMMLKSILRATNSDDAETRTYTTDLGQTVYGGTLDVVSGELVVDRAITLVTVTSSLAQDTDLNGYHRFYFRKDDVAKRTNYVGHIIASACPTVPNYAYFGTFDGEMAVTAYSVTSIGANYLYIISKSLSTVAEVQAQFAETPLQIVYELATPQTIQLTPQQVMLLTGDNNLWSDGTITMVYSTEVPTEGDITYPLEGEYTLTYRVTDKCGNVGEATRQITVVANEVQSVQNTESEVSE